MKLSTIVRFLDNVSFVALLLLWIGLVIFFGFIYAAGAPALFNQEVNLGNAIYYSFIASATVGFGPLIPTGYAKFLAILEFLASLLLYGIVISKLVSFKQEIILDEVYTISFHEKINRLRSMLYLFRADLNRVTEQIEDGKKHPALLKESAVYVHNLANTMSDIDDLLHHRDDDSHYVKGVNFATFELILNSIIISMDKLTEFFTVVHQHKLPLEIIHFNASLSTIKTVNKAIIQQYKDIDDIRIKNKLGILETLTKKIEYEAAVKD